MWVETVRGARAVDGLGTTLMHEHVFVLTPDVMQNYGHEWWWDEQDRGADAVRQLQALKDAGVDEAQITAMLVHNPARFFTGRPARTWRPWSRSVASGWPIGSCGTVPRESRGACARPGWCAAIGSPCAIRPG